MLFMLTLTYGNKCWTISWEMVKKLGDGKEAGSCGDVVLQKNAKAVMDKESYE